MENRDIRRQWGERIKSARGELTQRQLADLLGVTPQAVSFWERGDTAPKPAMQAAIATALDASWADLFDVGNVA